LTFIHLRVPAVVAVYALVAVMLAGCAGSSTATPATPAAPPSTEAGSGAATSVVPGAGVALPDEIDVATAARERDAGAFILDVREPDEWAAGHIPGATLIPLGQLTARAGEVPTDRDVVVVCRSGNRSAQGRDILRAAGLMQVTSTAGGMKAWTAAGNPTTTGE
jgi:rhodanese-related sulfurtransferase